LNYSFHLLHNYSFLLGSDSCHVFQRDSFLLSNSLLQALKVVCQDMFFSRSRPSAPTMIGRLTNKSSLELAFKHSQSAAYKTDILGELISLKVGHPADFDSKVGCLAFITLGLIMLLLLACYLFFII